jgi:hypothetical protein
MSEEKSAPEPEFDFKLTSREMSEIIQGLFMRHEVHTAVVRREKALGRDDLAAADRAKQAYSLQVRLSNQMQNQLSQHIHEREKNQ